jgi:hypothetical protein
MVDFSPGRLPASDRPVPGSAPPVAVDRVSLAAVLASATAIGVFPYALFVGTGTTAVVLGRGWIAVPALAALAAGVIALVRLRGFTTLATERPRLLELLLGGWTSVAAGAAISLIGMVLYGAARAVLWLVRPIAEALGGGFDTAAAARWALWASLAAVALMVVGSARGAAEELAGKLYPNTAGARSPFHALLVEKRHLLEKVVLAVLVAIAVGIVVFAVAAYWRPPWRALAAWLAVFFLYTAVSLDGLHRPQGESARRQRTVRALAKLLVAAGYEAHTAPRTGRSDVDPLIANVDLLALSPRRALVIEIKDGDGGKPVEWHEASRVRTAAWALEEVLREEQRAIEVIPVLVLFGRPRHPSLEQYLKDEPLTVAEIDDPELIGEALREEDPARLRALAIDRLGIRTALVADAEMAVAAGGG